jgi:hypothetical protein
MKINEIVQTGMVRDGWSTEIKLTKLVKYILSRKPKVIVEVGVYLGRSFFPLYWAGQEVGAEVCGVDPFCLKAATFGQEGEDLSFWGKLDYEWMWSDFMAEVNKLPKPPHIRRVQSRLVEDIDKIDFLHIDGNHSAFESLHDLHHWLPKMNAGGLVIFDDCDWPSVQDSVKHLDSHCKFIEDIQTTNLVKVYEII